MPRSERYNTKQKLHINDIIKNMNKPFTVKEVYRKIDGVGLTTIYRLVDKMTEEDKLRKFIAKDGKTYYQYLETCDKENHFYLKCDSCGNLTHIDCDCIDDIYKHILNNHKFKLSKKNIIINGLCNKCQRGEIWKKLCSH